MHFWLGISYGLRLVLLFAAGTLVAGLINWAVYNLGWHTRPYSPWSRFHPTDERSRWLDRAPLWGWLRLRRKQQELGYDFWLRPLVIELATGALFAGLYVWEIGEWGLVYVLESPIPPPANLPVLLHAQYVFHLVLISLMLAASFVDLDERTIPDEVTVVGTLVALIALAALPECRLIDIVLFGSVRWLHLASPNIWPAALDTAQPAAIAVALGCLWLWAFGLLPRIWRGRHGWRRALALMLARIVRERFSYLVLAIALLATAGIFAVWAAGGARWEALLSGLVGMAVGGGMVWVARILGTWLLGREAMGFGDVTLLAMIGSFLGWQSAVVIFFLAPFIGGLAGIVTLVVHRENEIPYGPFLCLAALGTLVCWRPLWQKLDPTFAFPWAVPVLIAICFIGMGVLLALLALVRRRWPGREA